MDGNLVTNVETIKDMAAKAYKHRLRHRPIKEGMEEMKKAKEKVALKVMEAASNNKTDSWDMADLDIVLKKLKNNKSRDPHGLVNELFKDETAGEDLKVAIIHLMNRIKDEQIYPKCLELCNISSIWKLKRPRNRFSSYRGIFRVSIFRAILDRLIYNDEYEKIDSNLTSETIYLCLMPLLTLEKTHMKKPLIYKCTMWNNVLTRCGLKKLLHPYMRLALKMISCPSSS